MVIIVNYPARAASVPPSLVLVPESGLPDGLDVESVGHIMSQLSCSSEFAIRAFQEMNITIVIGELRCDRELATRLLLRHRWDPFLVRAYETNYNTQIRGNIDDPEFEPSELRTTWGTTVPFGTDTEEELIFSVDGKWMRADPDYLEFEWVEDVPPLRASLRCDKSGYIPDDSTTIASDSESSSSSCLSHQLLGCVPLISGDAVVLHGLQGASELNGSQGQILRFIPATERFEVRLDGFSGTKAVRAANLRLL